MASQARQYLLTCNTRQQAFFELHGKWSSSDTLGVKMSTGDIILSSVLPVVQVVLMCGAGSLAVRKVRSSDFETWHYG